MMAPPSAAKQGQVALNTSGLPLDAYEDWKAEASLSAHVAKSIELRPVDSQTSRHAGLPDLGLKRALVTMALIAASIIMPPPPLAIGMAAMAVPPAVVAKAPSQQYLLFTGFPFPLGPFTQRETVKTEVVKDRVYSFEQEIRLSGISANIRSTVFRMRDNHLLVYNPVAPTEEFLQQLKALDSAGVSHILLGATQYEHKVFVAPFARKFPNAKVWAVPDQWSFPLDLPSPLLGIDTKGSGGGELVDTSKGSAAYDKAPDLTAEFEVKLLRPARRLGAGYAANEAALLHRDTKTLVLTDALINVPARPTAVYDEALLLAIGDNLRDTNTLGNIILKGVGVTNWRGTGSQAVEELWADARQDSEAEQRQRGWERNVLLSLFFGPDTASIIDPDPSFQAIKGKWIVAPVTDSLIYKSSKVKPELARWVEDVGQWDFKIIAPSHFDAKEGTPDDFRAAFAPTLADSTRSASKASSDFADANMASASTSAAARPYPERDVRLLDDIAAELIKLGII